MNKENVKDVRVRNLAAVPHASIEVISLVSTSNDGPTSLQAEPDPRPYMRSNTVMMIAIVHVLWCCLDGNSSSLTACVGYGKGGRAHAGGSHTA